uniref:Peptidase S1 domain-containing protein n=1 Tax=Steinernema glaseri TaxID=37863 RepID=A0A1I7YDZ9_9BILA
MHHYDRASTLQRNLCSVSYSSTCNSSTLLEPSSGFPIEGEKALQIQHLYQSDFPESHSPIQTPASAIAVCTGRKAPPHQASLLYACSWSHHDCIDDIDVCGAAMRVSNIGHLQKWIRAAV